VRWTGNLDGYLKVETEILGDPAVTFGCRDMTAIVVYSVKFGLCLETVKGPLTLKHQAIARS